LVLAKLLQGFAGSPNQVLNHDSLLQTLSLKRASQFGHPAAPPFHLGVGRSQVIDGLVPRNGHDPCPEAASVFIETVDAIPNAQEHLLRQFFGDARVSHQMQEHGIDKRAVPVVQLSHRLRVSLQNSPCENRLLHRVGQCHASGRYSAVCALIGARLFWHANSVLLELSKRDKLAYKKQSEIRPPIGSREPRFPRGYAR
jgi:hypothetical protein